MVDETPQWITVASYGAVYEAELAATRLEAAGIPFRLNKGGAVGIFGAAFQGKTPSGVEVLVPSHEVEAARETLDLQDV